MPFVRPPAGSDLVKGRSQTYLPWDSWQRPHVLITPTVWFHDLFYEDGKPYREREVELFRSLTARYEGVR